MPPVISTSWHNTADRFLVFELYISRITYSFGSDSFYSILGWRMIHLCYYISSFCVDFHCDNIGQCTSLSVEDQHLGTFCCYCYCSVMSNSLWPHGRQHARLPCLSPSPGVCSNSCPLSWWCHPSILSSASLFSSCPQSFQASGSFPVSWLFTNCWSFSISPSNEYSGLISYRSDCFPSKIRNKGRLDDLKHSSSPVLLLVVYKPKKT